VGFFVMRTPLLALDRWVGWCAGLEAPALADDHPGLGAALVRDRVVQRERLSATLEEPVVREALLVASPDVAAGIGDWRANPGARRALRLERTLARYFARMAVRPTPFGLFAVVRWGALGRVARWRLRACRPGGGWRGWTWDIWSSWSSSWRPTLSSGVAVAAAEPDLVTARGRGFATCLTGARAMATGMVRGCRIGLPRSVYRRHLELALERAAAGATARELVEALVEQGVSPAGAESFVARLRRARVVIGQVTPPVTGPEPLGHVIEHLPTGHRACEALAE